MFIGLDLGIGADDATLHLLRPCRSARSVDFEAGRSWNIRFMTSKVLFGACAVVSPRLLKCSREHPLALMQDGFGWVVPCKSRLQAQLLQITRDRELIELRILHSMYGVSCSTCGGQTGPVSTPAPQTGLTDPFRIWITVVPPATPEVFQVQVSVSLNVTVIR
jgi:hypothetical protein